MDLITFVVVLVALGACWWLFTTYVPLPQPIKTIITVLFVVIMCVVILQTLGLTHLRIG